jgi:hypothetical protein
MTFNALIDALVKNNSQTLKVKNSIKQIKGMSRFTSINAYGDEYVKISFTDHTSMVLIIPSKEIFYSTQPIGKIINFHDKDIGVKETIQYKNVKFKLVNKNDYQFCLGHYVGEVGKDIEGECRFSDYLSEDNNHMLSLGWLSQSGKRADVYANKISLNKISIA